MHATAQRGWDLGKAEGRREIVAELREWARTFTDGLGGVQPELGPAFAVLAEIGLKLDEMEGKA